MQHALVVRLRVRGSRVRRRRGGLVGGKLERRSRRGPAVRFAMGALLVASIFFLPFILDDFVSHSKLVAASLVAVAWIAMRFALRSR